MNVYSHVIPDQREAAEKMEAALAWGRGCQLAVNRTPVRFLSWIRTGDFVLRLGGAGGET